MDPIIEAIAKLIPLGTWFESIGWNRGLGDLLSVAIAAGVVVLMAWMTTKLWKHNENLRAARNLMPQFDKASIRQARQYYIPTQYQNASPTRQEEPSFTHQYIARNKLVPFFIKIAFDAKIESERFYIVLADSGMGKTTFMINLYLAYISFFNFRRKKKIRLFRFSHPDTLSDIKLIDRTEARDTILLLDALDEDPEIVSKDSNESDAQAFQRRIDEIIETTRIFFEVVITCRTQYFPKQEDHPYELKVKRPDERGFYVLNKIYISPFTDNDVKRYLNKKYGITPNWLNKRKKRAEDVVKQSHLLTIRPMLLSYIDYLIGEPRTYRSLYEIYETLIEQWFVREGEKRKNAVERKEFIDQLRRVSEECAFQIYLNINRGYNPYLEKNEALTVAKENGIDLRSDEITGQSLLTCDAYGNWKFAHKSILEFFMAKRAISDFNFFMKFNFNNMDMAQRFFEEKNPLNLCEIKHYQISKNGVSIQRSFWICYKYPYSSLDKISEEAKQYIRSIERKRENHYATAIHTIESLKGIEASLGADGNLELEICNYLNQKYRLRRTSLKDSFKTISDAISSDNSFMVADINSYLLSLQPTFRPYTRVILVRSIDTHLTIDLDIA